MSVELSRTQPKQEATLSRAIIRRTGAIKSTSVFVKGLWCLPIMLRAARASCGGLLPHPREVEGQFRRRLECARIMLCGLGISKGVSGLVYLRSCCTPLHGTSPRRG